MVRKTMVLWVFLATSVLAIGCQEPSPAPSEDRISTSVNFDAVFTGLSYVDVYSEDGEFVETVDGFSDFEATLLSGSYHMDFVDENGGHSFMDDGRLAFVPTIQGGLLVGGPVALPGVDSQLWEVDVHPTLEANAYLSERVRSGDLSLAPWAEVLGMDADFSDIEDLDGVRRNPMHTLGSDVAKIRARLVWEAARAMIGPTAPNTPTWDTANTYASYAYVSEDGEAWKALRVATTLPATKTNPQVVGWYLSCRNDADTANQYASLVPPAPCCLTKGSDNVSEYVWQAWRTGCTGSLQYHGGQCKPFMNLVAYRSGVYHGPSWAFKRLPTDPTINTWSTAADQMPWATSSNLAAGDLLRRTDGHAVIVVRVVSATQVVVVDSNWLGGDGRESVGSHTMSFSGGGDSNLSNYRVLKCVYTGGC